MSLSSKKSRENSILGLTLLFIVTINIVPSFGITPQVSAGTYSYTIGIEDSYYVVRNYSGVKISSGIDFGALFNLVNSMLKTGDTVLIKSGTYLSKTYGMLTKQSIVVSGESGAVVRSASTTLPTNYLFMILGSYNTITGITFDAYKNTVISPSVVIGGSYNTISNCKCINALQYNLEASRADHFKIINNYCTYSQYGIATMGFDSWCTDGVISGNTITDCLSSGIKIRNAINVVVENNYIDCAYVQYTERYSYPSEAGMIGLYLAVGDGPSVNVTFQNNKVVDSKMEKQTRGFWTQSEVGVYWLSKTSIRTSNIKIINNRFEGLYAAITTAGSFCYVSGNTVISRSSIPSTATSTSPTSSISNSIVVTSPNGGERWVLGKVYSITWNNVGSTGSYVKIELLKAGVVVKVISSSAVNSGVQKWLVPSTLALGTDYRIRVTSKSDSGITDQSNANFALVSG